MRAKDYELRTYLSSIEVAKILGTSVEHVLALAKEGQLPVQISASGQKRFRLSDVERLAPQFRVLKNGSETQKTSRIDVEVNSTRQTIIIANSQSMKEIDNESVHLVITSPPYFNTKLYTREPIEGDLGNIHTLDEWLYEIGKVWQEVFRILQPGRRFFINIMHLPIRLDDGSFRTLNLVGKTIDLCEEIGFIFKRDIIWHKTNSVRAHFGTFPYPGGILINHMHEFILEFSKPERKGFKKYAHLTEEQKEMSKLDKEFWISIKKSDVWVMKPEGSGDQRSHVAPFPYELPYRLIKAFSYVGETVVDPFVGSGTTLVAAANLKRNGIGYEINPEIAIDASKRFKTHQLSLEVENE